MTSTHYVSIPDPRCCRCLSLLQTISVPCTGSSGRPSFSKGRQASSPFGCFGDSRYQGIPRRAWLKFFVPRKYRGCRFLETWTVRSALDVEPLAAGDARPSCICGEYQRIFEAPAAWPRPRWSSTRSFPNVPKTLSKTSVDHRQSQIGNWHTGGDTPRASRYPRRSGRDRSQPETPRGAKIQTWDQKSEYCSAILPR